MDCKKTLWVAVLLCCIGGSSGCYTVRHTVGKGPRTHEKVEGSLWYALGGLIPIDPIDSKELAGGATDYQVTTEFTFLDIVIDTFTSFLGFIKQTIIVEK